LLKGLNKAISKGIAAEESSKLKTKMYRHKCKSKNKLQQEKTGKYCPLWLWAVHFCFHYGQQWIEKGWWLGCL